VMGIHNLVTDVERRHTSPRNETSRG